MEERQAYIYLRLREGEKTLMIMSDPDPTHLEDNEQFVLIQVTEGASFDEAYEEAVNFTDKLHESVYDRIE